jgi:hypothetical protein
MVRMVTDNRDMCAFLAAPFLFSYFLYSFLLFTFVDWSCSHLVAFGHDLMIPL